MHSYLIIYYCTMFYDLYYNRYIERQGPLISEKLLWSFACQLLSAVRITSMYLYRLAVRQNLPKLCCGSAWLHELSSGCRSLEYWRICGVALRFWCMTQDTVVYCVWTHVAKCTRLPAHIWRTRYDTSIMLGPVCAQRWLTESMQEHHTRTCHCHPKWPCQVRTYIWLYIYVYIWMMNIYTYIYLYMYMYMCVRESRHSYLYWAWLFCFHDVLTSKRGMLCVYNRNSVGKLSYVWFVSMVSTIKCILLWFLSITIDCVHTRESVHTNSHQLHSLSCECGAYSITTPLYCVALTHMHT